MKENIRIAYSMLYDLSGVPFTIMTRSGEVVISFPEHLEEYYNTDFWLKNQSEPTEKNHHPNGATVFEIGKYCYVGICKLSEELIFCTVPVRANAMIKHNFLPALINGFRQDRLVEFYHFLLEVPVRTNYQLTELCSLAKQIYCGKPTEGVNLRHLVPPEERITVRDAMEFDAMKEDRGLTRHAPTSYEKSIMDAITAGDLSTLRAIFSRPVFGGIGKMSLNEVRQAKYEFICMMYAASRAAIAGGMSMEASFDLSDYYCQRMDAMENAQNITAYIVHCLESYCKRVVETKKTGAVSAYTRAAQEHIEKHIYEPMDVEAVCAAVGLNKKSLGEYMKRDTGMSIAAYILDRRLSEAAYLLKNSDMVIAAISELTQFSSQSHFTQRFKEKFGVPPLQYRLRQQP